MYISKKIKTSMETSSFIRKMFEEGLRLKEQFGEENVFDFSLGNPDLSPPEKFFNILKHIDDDYQKGLHGYMPNAGFDFVRERIAQKVAKDHTVDIKSDNIVMTVGAAGALNVIFKTVLNPGEEVIVPAPYFVEYNSYVENHNGKIVAVKTRSDFLLDIDAIESTINEKTKAVLINSPHNPTGRIYSENQINDLCKLLERIYVERNQVIFLIADEPYREIVYDNKTVPPILSKYQYSIVATSFSKTLSIPGERIGYIALSPLCLQAKEIMNGFVLSNRILGFVNAPALIQRIVSELLDEKVDVETYKKRRDIFIKGLQDAGIDFVPPEGAFYIFCKSPIDDDVKFIDYLKSYNILAVPGIGFGTPGWFRLCYCVENKIIEKSLPFFKKAMENLNF